LESTQLRNGMGSGSRPRAASAARRAVTAVTAARRARQADATAARSCGGNNGRTSSADSVTAPGADGFLIPDGSERNGTDEHVGLLWFVHHNKQKNRRKRYDLRGISLVAAS
jgi:hypothetical protein